MGNNAQSRNALAEETPLLNERNAAGSSTAANNLFQSSSYSSVSASQQASSLNSQNRNTILFPKNEKLSIMQRLPYYIPILHWLPKYNTNTFLKDFSAGISVASFQIPLAISFATTMAHVSPLCGLLSLSFTPMVYCVTGSISQMIVGPESAISLIVGQTVDHLLKMHPEDKKYLLNPLLITAALTFISGITLFVSGIFRLGFLDNILSQVLLMGFISGVGSTMIVSSFITQCKLDQTILDVPEHYHSTFDKIMFLFKYCNWDSIHFPTFMISLISCILLFSIKFAKKRYANHRKKANWVFYVPEILIITIGVTIISYSFDFKKKYDIVLVSSMFTSNGKHSKGVNVIKKLKSQLWLPPLKTLRKYSHELIYPGVTIAMLGFFESATASKALGSTYNLELSSSNRELIALGSLNIVGSFFGGCLPSFGGYGRSRINALSGAQTTVSGFIMGFFTLLITIFCFQMIGHIPLCLLASVTALIGFTLLEECPSLLRFHFRCGGYMELFLFFIVNLTTLTFSLEMGITVGLICSIIIVVKNATKSRIQILGRLSGSHMFVNADDLNYNSEGDNTYDEHYEHPNVQHPHTVEELEGCLIVKICEPLSFTNSSDLKSKLTRLEKFGSQTQHPAAPRSRGKSMTRYIIFDIEGMTSIDSSASLVLFNLIKRHVHSGSKVFLVASSIPITVKNILANSKVLELVQYDEYNRDIGDVFFKSIQDALNTVDYIEACGESQTMKRRGTLDSVTESVFNHIV